MLFSRSRKLKKNIFAHMMLKMKRGILTIIAIMACTYYACKTPQGATQSDSKQETEITSDQMDYAGADRIRYQDYIYNENIQSVVLRKEGALLTFPVIELNGSERLELLFDDLDHDVKYYRYTLIHCSFDWKPTPDAKEFYLNGFTEDLISESRFSFNTLQGFTHYRLVFPNSNMGIRRSGNYLLMVWDEKQAGKPVLTRRFCVVEPSLRISVNIKKATGIDERNYRQEVDFSINTSARRVDDPFRNLSVALLQNGRWDNAITTLKPRIINGDDLSYDYDDKNVFDGGNEYRWFDIRTIKHAVDNVAYIDRDSALYHIHLMPDMRRPYTVYVNQNDINGKRLIATYDGRDQNTEPDYVWVYFTLKYPAPFIDGNVYVSGELADWNFGPKNMMRYDPDRGVYSLRMLLKQGFYNYHYALLPNNSVSSNASLIEGTHSETENDYFILAYYRQPGSVYDELIGFINANTRK